MNKILVTNIKINYEKYWYGRQISIYNSIGIKVFLTINLGICLINFLLPFAIV